jgi:hypothetical protein
VRRISVKDWWRGLGVLVEGFGGSTLKSSTSKLAFLIVQLSACFVHGVVRWESQFRVQTKSDNKETALARFATSTEGYGSEGFQSMAVYFPGTATDSGCWKH